MKIFKVCLVVLSVALIPISSHAQNSNTHYVVIGAFRQLENAARFTATATTNGFAAQYAIQPARQLYYVYLLSTQDKKEAYNLLIKIKVETDYKDAWVFTGVLGKEEISQPVVAEPAKEQPVVRG